MVEWSTSGLQIVSALIGSGLLITIFSSMYNEFLNKPHLNIVVQPDLKNVHRDSVIITNDGQKSATHLELKIRTPANFSLIDNFSTVGNISLSKINSSLLAVNTPLFVQGSGSMIRIGMNLNYTGLLLGPVVVDVARGSIADSIGMSRGSVIHMIAGQNIIHPADMSKILKSDLGKTIQITWLEKNGKTISKALNLPFSVKPNKPILGITHSRSLGSYTIYATYDEGSVKKDIPGVLCLFFVPQWYMINYGAFRDYQAYLDFKEHIFTYMIWSSLFALSVIVFTFPQIYKKFFKRLNRDKIRFLSDILNEVIMVRSILYKDPMYQNVLSESWTSMLESMKLQFIDKINSYLLLDDFYSKLAKRNSFLTTNKSVEKDILMKYNKDCIGLADKALIRVDWPKYSTIQTEKITHTSRLKVLFIASVGGFFLPGIAHIYIGRWKKGILILSVSYVLLLLYFEGIIMQYETSYSCSDAKLTTTIMTYLIFAYFGIWIWQAVDARKLVQNIQTIAR